MLSQLKMNHSAKEHFMSSFTPVKNEIDFFKDALGYDEKSFIHLEVLGSSLDWVLCQGKRLMKGLGLV